MKHRKEKKKLSKAACRIQTKITAADKTVLWLTIHVIMAGHSCVMVFWEIAGLQLYNTLTYRTAWCLSLRWCGRRKLSVWMPSWYPLELKNCETWKETAQGAMKVCRQYNRLQILVSHQQSSSLKTNLIRTPSAILNYNRMNKNCD